MNLELEANNAHRLCDTCIKHNIWDYLTDNFIQSPKNWIDGFFTSRAETLERSSCPFCALVIRLLPENAFSESTKLYYDAEKPYCDLRPVYYPAGGTKYPAWRVTYVWRSRKSFVDNWHRDGRGEIALNSPEREKYNTDTVSAVEIPPQIDFDLLRHWLNVCTKEHNQCSEVQDRNHSRPVQIMLIDLEENCLVPADTSFSYVALSYVWGSQTPSGVKIMSKARLMKHGSLGKPNVWPYLPLAVREATNFAREVSRYLWVDCICIDQEDADTMANQVLNMDEIYSRAILTFIPMGARNASSPFPGGLQSRMNPRTTVRSPSGSTEELVITVIPDFKALLMDSDHESRAWTMQEKILSTRCVFLSSYSMWFQCREASFTDVLEEKSPPNISERTPEVLLREIKDDHNADDSCNEFSMSAFFQYLTLVEWYTARSLTYTTDRLIAFQGIMHRIEFTCNQEFLWGHPIGDTFGSSLLWTPVDTYPITEDGTPPPDGEMPKLKDYLPQRDVYYPTWSWAGWKNSRANFSLIHALHRSELGAELDDMVEIEHWPTLDEESVRASDKSVQNWDPRLFQRYCNQGHFTIRTEAIPASGFCCRMILGENASNVPTLDGDTAWPFVMGLYEWSEAVADLDTTEKMPVPPIGTVAGVPLYGRTEPKHERMKLILMKSIPSEANDGDLHLVLKSFHRTLEKLRPVKIAMLVLCAGRHTERFGLVVIDADVWESRGPHREELQML